MSTLSPSSPAIPARASLRAALLVFLIALAIRAAACTNLDCISRDGAHFVGFAKALDRDPIPAMRAESKQPGFPWLLLAARRALGERFSAPEPIQWERAGQAIASLGGALSCLLLYLLTARLFNRSTAAVAGFFACLWPQNVSLSADVLSDTPHLAVYLASILLAYRAITRGSVATIAFAGLLAGLAYWLRQEAIGLSIIPLCWLLSAATPDRKRRWLGAAAFLLCMFALAAPYSVAVGKLIPNKSPWDDRAREDASAIPQHPPSYTPTPAYADVVPWTAAPLRMLELWSKSGRYVFSTLALLGAILPFAPRADRNGRNLVFAILIVHLILVEARVAKYGEISSRYLLLPAALAIPWAAGALHAIVRRISLKPIAQHESASSPSPPSTPTTAKTAWIVALLVCAVPMSYYAARPIGTGDAPLRSGGLWLLEHADPQDAVIGHEHLDQFMFYADRSKPDPRWIALPESDGLRQIAGAIDRTGANWVVADELALKDRTQSKVDELRRSRRSALQLQWTGRNKQGLVVIFAMRED